MNRNIIVSFLFFTIILHGAAHRVKAYDDIEAHRDCPHCGMDRKAFGYSRMLILYEDGTESGVCSIHCALVDINENQGRKVKTILVADRKSRILIDAEKAIWVLGGKKSGVMTKHPKWAFGSKESAQQFIDANGGEIASWEETLAAAREDLQREVR
jgi:copper chaperone NosL